ncbi:cytochrome-c peroxidase [Pedobacter sp. N23S346]|uniref:cytochrome-c peroxidase n=1 Tax=Pedobacter sp. N23S346 TaxID=3402750 RepID=UPI003AC66851
MPYNKKIFFLILMISISTSLAIFCKMDRKSNADLVKTEFSKDLSALQENINNQLLNAAKNKDENGIKKAFLQARLKYKEIEFYIEYFFPTTAGLLNGAPIDEIELGENLVKNPSGFQVMEELVYNVPNQENRSELLNEIKKMKLNLERVSRFNDEYEITDAQIFDAIRLEILRITSLGITGFDAPVALNSLPEAVAALGGIKKVLTVYDEEASGEKIDQSIHFIQRTSSFDEFDRIGFTTDYLQPLGSEIAKLRKRLNIPTAASGAALREGTVSLFETNAFDVDKFVGNSTMFISNEKISLGKSLFDEVMLSKNLDRSCQSCHHQSMAFTDGLVRPLGISKGKVLDRNTPTLSYAGLQRGFFYDLKAGSLEDQALDVIHQKEEMGGSLEQAAQRINTSGKYQKAMKNAYKDDSEATPWKIQHALAAYIRSLSPFSSRLDRYMRGDRSQLSTIEKTGYNLFMGKAKCGSCHFAPLFNGTQSPMFIKSEAEVLGVPAKADTAHAKIDSDLGRFGLYQYPQFKYAFKTPTLRNISKTAPYMHNGVYQTLEQVVDFYNRGGGAGIGISLDNQTLSGDQLKLNKSEIKSIVAFLTTLDDES